MQKNKNKGQRHISQIFDPSLWIEVPGPKHTDITFHIHHTGKIARIGINRPHKRNAFRPQTVDELYSALDHSRCDPQIGVVLLTGNGPDPKDGVWAFCSGGDQSVRSSHGYSYSAPTGDRTDGQQPPLPRLHILEVQRIIRFMPKVVIALVSGWAAGGGHSLNVVCDLSIASAEHARFKQTDATVGSFDAGYGSAYLAKQVGQKRAREIFFLAQEYSAQKAYEMGVVNLVVPHELLEHTGIQWAERILQQSPTSIRMLKYALGLQDDGLVGQQLFAGEATRLAYTTDESLEGRDSFIQKRPPDWSSFPYYY